MSRLTPFLIGSLLSVAPVGLRAQVGEGSEPIVGLPCEGCEGVFEGVPDHLTSAARIAAKSETGSPMRIRGTVYGDDGPAEGVIVYAYHTDAQGIYPAAEGSDGWTHRHGRLRGWTITDQDGRYQFDTIRPASYPGREVPAHVHMHVIEVGCCTYYIDDIQFDDDPLLSNQALADLAGGRGGSGLVHPELDTGGVWLVTRDIRLGEHIPGYD